MTSSKRAVDSTAEPPTPNPNEMLSVPKVAKEAGIGAAFCWRLVRSKTIPAKRIGRRVLVRRGDLADYLQSLPNAYDDASGSAPPA